jgi:hypothetical protein
VRTAQRVSGSYVWDGELSKGLTMVWLGQRDRRVRAEESRMEMTK